jgi:hypothetical protein
MKTPTIEEVKNRYANVKKVEGTCGIIGVIDLKTIYKGMTDCICCETKHNKRLILYDKDENKYAKIISYKSNANIDLSKLTTDHIIELCKEPNIKEFMINNGVVKNELEVGKWYKSEKTGLWFIEEIINKEREKSFGIGKLGNFFSSRERYQSGDYIPATPQEVETALKNEAVKRGFVYGIKYESPQSKIPNTCNGRFRFDSEINVFYSNGVAVFMDGVWAEIITQEETYIKVPLSIITLTDSNKKLGALVRSISENY